MTPQTQTPPPPHTTTKKSYINSYVFNPFMWRVHHTRPWQSCDSRNDNKAWNMKHEIIYCRNSCLNHTVKENESKPSDRSESSIQQCCGINIIYCIPFLLSCFPICSISNWCRLIATCLKTHILYILVQCSTVYKSLVENNYEISQWTARVNSSNNAS